MPEGHTIHRLARALTEGFAGDPVASSSPQGRFTSGADLLDGDVPLPARAHGKHLFVPFDPGRIVHVHLGLYGKFHLTSRASPDAAVPEPVGMVRWRLVGPRAYADLRGATACEVLDEDRIRGIEARLGPDPLGRVPDPRPFLATLERSRAPMATLLMDQRVIAGIGNVYRAEALFRGRIPPMLPGRSLGAEAGVALWQDLRLLLRAGVRSGRIVTTAPEHRVRRRGAATREDAHYVYRRTGLPCRVCGTPIAAAELGGRNLFWCPSCQG